MSEQTDGLKKKFPELYELLESILGDTLRHLWWDYSSIYEVLEKVEEGVREARLVEHKLNCQDCLSESLGQGETCDRRKKLEGKG